MSNGADRPMSNAIIAAFGPNAGHTQDSIDGAVSVGAQVGWSIETEVHTAKIQEALGFFFSQPRMEAELRASGVQPRSYTHLILAAGQPEVFESLLSTVSEEVIGKLGDALSVHAETHQHLDYPQDGTLRALARLLDLDIGDTEQVRFRPSSRREQAQAIAAGNEKFYGFTLAAIGYGVAIGLKGIERCLYRQDIPKNASRHQKAILLCLADFLEKYDMILPATSTREVYRRLKIAYPADERIEGVFDYLLHYDRAAFGVSPNDPHSGCPMVGFTHQLTHAFGRILAKPENERAFIQAVQYATPGPRNLPM